MPTTRSVSKLRPRVLMLSALIVVSALAILPVSALGADSDLSITIADSADPIPVGAELVYSVVVTSGGPDAANGVTIDDKLPGHVDLLGATASQGACDAKGTKVACELGALAPGASATATIRVRPSKDGQLSNTVSVSGAEADPYKPNDSDTEVTTVVPGPAIPTCAGKAATIVGTAGPDSLVGTTKVDVIVALGGDDSIQGLGGNDIVCGAAGNDAIKGQAGNDAIRGGSGDDQVRGGGGGDKLRGGGGADRLAGGAGNDSLFGGGGADVCRGGGGSDTKRRC